MYVPFNDFRRLFSPHRAFVSNTITEVASRGEFILKQQARELEQAICDLTGAQYATAAASATGAILLGLKALGVGPGIEVLTPAFGFASPVNCILNLGGKPVFVDVDFENGLLDPNLIEERITNLTRVVLPMHLGRAVADMKTITDVAQAHNLSVLEDSAVAFAADIDGVPAGRWGNAGVFSFYPSKPLGGIGDSGMLITDDPEIAKSCRRLRNHGQEEGRRFVYQEVGWNNRMDEITAAFLLMKLPTFAATLNRRAKINDIYDRSFAKFRDRLTPLVSAVGRGHHKYAVFVEDRDALCKYLDNCGIETELFYAPPLHLHPAFMRLGYRTGDFPVAERLGQGTLALPCYPEMTDEEVAYVAKKVADFYAK